MPEHVAGVPTVVVWSGPMTDRPTWHWLPCGNVPSFVRAENRVPARPMNPKSVVVEAGTEKVTAVAPGVIERIVPVDVRRNLSVAGVWFCVSRKIVYVPSDGNVRLVVAPAMPAHNGAAIVDAPFVIDIITSQLFAYVPALVVALTTWFFKPENV